MTDRIEKEILIRAPRSRVWRAISDKTEFGTWFEARFAAGPFVAGEKVNGQITTKGYEHVPMNIEIVDVEPESRLSYRWHPYGIDPAVDYSQETPTLVTFTLSDAPEGTRLQLVESGFDLLPPQRRTEALEKNDRGWTAQLHNIERHVASE